MKHDMMLWIATYVTVSFERIRISIFAFHILLDFTKPLWKECFISFE